MKRYTQKALVVLAAIVLSIVVLQLPESHKHSIVEMPQEIELGAAPEGVMTRGESYNVRGGRPDDFGDGRSSSGIRIASFGSVASSYAADKVATASLSANRMVIKTASLRCEVDDFSIAVVTIEQITDENEGYIVATESENHDHDIESGYVTIRIPNDRFEETMVQIKSSVAKVIREQVRGDDVSEEYFDITARLKNKKQAEVRYREILTTATDTEDILSVEKALTDVREAMERLEGRKHYLEDKVTMSTISVHMHEPRPLVVTGESGFMSRIERGFEGGIIGFANTLSNGIMLTIASAPLWIMILLGLWIVRGYLRRRRQDGVIEPVG